MRSSTLLAWPVAALLLATLYGHRAAGETRVQGSTENVRVEAHGATVAEILAALGEHYAVRYRGTPVGSDLTATFEGPLRRVVARVLEGNDFVIRKRGDGLEVLVLSPASPGAFPRAPRGSVVRERDPFMPR